MVWNPKNWDWTHRFDDGFVRLCRTTPRAAIYGIHALLIGSRFEGANLGGSLRFANAKHFTQDHVNAAYADSATILPDGITMPDHWDTETIEPWDDDSKYHFWLASGAPPGKPRKPQPA